MSCRSLSAVLFVALLPHLCGQGTGKRFEVVSIRPATSRTSPAGLTVDPGHIRLTGDVTALLRAAYQLPDTRFFGIERKIGSPFPYFELQATLPPGSSPSGIPEMLKGVLAERFGLSAHQEQREQEVYLLEVAPSGLKQQYVHTVDSQIADATALRPLGASKVRGTMERLAELLSLHLNREVLNKTAAEGKYEIDFTFEPPPNLAPKSLNEAKSSHEQSMIDGIERVGFKLKPAKAKLDCVIVDHVSTTPTDN